MTKLIGYQGMEGSNSLAAAEDMVATLGWTDVEYVPLLTSRGVVDAMLAGEVEYGVMATVNSVAGPVVETDEALEGVSYRVLAGNSVHIHHCLFVRDPSVTEIDTVASHIQALGQCATHLNAHYAHAKWQELEDTAIGARYLSEGVLPPTTGVLCRRNAGEAYGLHLMEENLEDNENNYTSFALITLVK